MMDICRPLLVGADGGLQESVLEILRALLDPTSFTQKVCAAAFLTKALLPSAAWVPAVCVDRKALVNLLETVCGFFCRPSRGRAGQHARGTRAHRGIGQRRARDEFMTAILPLIAVRHPPLRADGE